MALLRALSFIFGVMALSFGVSVPSSAQSLLDDAPGALPVVDAPTWREDPVVQFDMNLAAGATYAPDSLMVDTSTFGAERSLAQALKALPCVETRRHFKGSITTLQCEGGVRDAIDVLHRSFHLWSEALFYERQAEEGDERDPAKLYDLDLKQWHHQNKGQNIAGSIGRMGADIRSIEAWRDTPGDTPGVLIAIIDSGVDFTHPELAELAWKSPREVCGNNLDDDHNGFIDDCDGWDFGDEDANPSPRSLPTESATCKRWHGTFIAGLSSGVGDNGEGISGVHWGTQIINIKKHDDATCRSTTMQSILATRYAVAAGAKILQMPFVSAARSAMFESELRAAAASDVVLVMSAGNDGRGIDADELYPASYDLDAQLVVAYTTNQDTLSEESNFGALSVDLAAPGESVYSSDEELDYAIRSGSSYAVPVVAGVVSLLRAAFPSLSASDIAEAIIEGAKPLEALSCASSPARCVSSGARLDAVGALEQASSKLDGPSLSLDRMRVLDFAGDGFLSPGERAQFQYELFNRGRASSPLAVSIEILDPQQNITLTPSEFTIPALASRERFVSTGQFSPSLIVDPSCSRNVDLTLTMSVRDDLGHIWVRDLPLRLACGLDQDADGVPPPIDCHDDDPTIAPNLPETCDGVDNDCDGQIDEDATVNLSTFYADLDADGFGSTTMSLTTCTAPQSYVSVSGDCDDADPNVGPFLDASGQMQCGVYPAMTTPGASTGCCATTPSGRAASTLTWPTGLWYTGGLLTVLLVRIRRRVAHEHHQERH